MTSPLDMTLEELSKQNKPSRRDGGPRRDGGFRNGPRRDGGFRNGPRRDGGFRDRPRGGINKRNGGPVRREGRNTRRNHPYSTSIPDQKWGHDGFEQSNGPKRNAFVNRDDNINDNQLGYKVKISNLRFDVLEDDLQELFDSIGNVVKVKVFYDKSGRSKGEAAVTFKNLDSAKKAVSQYNGRKLDETELKLELLGRDRGIKGGDRFQSNKSDRGVKSSDIMEDDNFKINVSF